MPKMSRNWNMVVPVIAAATVWHAALHLHFQGHNTGGLPIDWSVVMKEKPALVEELRQAKHTDVLSAYHRLMGLPGVGPFLRRIR